MNRRQFLLSGCAALGSTRLRAASPDRIAVDLVVAKNWVSVAGRAAEFYTYNGELTGPQLDICPGQEVVIRLINRLTEPTNLHFHGLHLAPSPGVDDALMSLSPGEEHEYRFTLPADHPAGTFWYHPHVHGFTANQVGGGLAGTIVVRSPVEQDLGLASLPERVLILQDFDLLADGRLAQPTQMERMNGREGALVTASGAVTPTIEIPLTGAVRIRCINACSSRFFLLAMEKRQPVTLIAVDGGLLPAPVIADDILLAPGERVDLVVSGNLLRSAPDRLVSLPYRRLFMGMGGQLSTPSSFPIANLVPVADDSVRWELPATLIPTTPLPPASRTRTFTLAQGMTGRMGAQGGMSPTINGRTFDMSRIDTEVRLGAVEDWEFLNTTAADHPMHVHTNPFQILDSRGEPQPAWKDTVVVKAGTRVRVRTRFEDFSGTSVYHCHILDHEDMGMMGTLQISA